MNLTQADTNFIELLLNFVIENVLKILDDELLYTFINELLTFLKASINLTFF